MFHFTQNIIHGFRSGAYRDQFQNVTWEDTAKQKTKGLVLIAMLSLRLSLSIYPSSSFNLFVHCTAAAHFWSTVVCLCQMPKRLRNEEGHMKRGRVTVATVCNHTHKNCHRWISQTVLASETLSFANPVSFTNHCLFRNTGKVKWKNMVTWMKFNWNRTELGEFGEQQTNYQ